MSLSYETRQDWSYPSEIPLQEHCCWLFVHEHLEAGGHKGIASWLPALAMLVLLIILPREEDMWVEKAA